MARRPISVIGRTSSKAPILVDTGITSGISVVTAGIRRAMQDRTQNQTFWGRVKPTPTYEELKKQNDALITTVAGDSPDWNTGNLPTIQQIGERIDRNLYISVFSSKKGYEDKEASRIKIQHVPLELDYNPESSFVPIASMARNNPIYHYTGSEDILKFTLDWYATDEDREEVLLACKFMEALSKNNSFEEPPPRVKLIWGPNNKMFADATWLVVAAPYKLSNFQAHKNMMPQQAYQEITLKRVLRVNPKIDTIKSLTF